MKIRRTTGILALSAFLISACDKQSDTQASTDELIERGMSALKTVSYDSAYDYFARAQATLTQEDPRWTQVVYGEALSSWYQSPANKTSVNTAVGLLNQIIEAKPQSEFAASAMIDLGRIHEVVDYPGDEADVEAAQSYYNKVRDQFADSDMSIRASIYLAQSMAQSLTPENIREAISVLNQELMKQPSPSWSGLLQQYKAQLYAYYLHEPKQALEPYAEAMRDGFPKTSDSDKYLWQLGVLAGDNDDLKLESEAYTNILNNYPRSAYGSVARDELTSIQQAHPELGIQLPQQH
ncbi:tetratricopeptide repeat protein [Coraliomargarita parva]|uniref:tetratricopeptide repeat protein n=1 Tax=Coraliomargarita parva TaxID=3014050 RepID=UPI0022B52CFA|nr:hypothetical protein [Coraliomargarita parva]